MKQSTIIKDLISKTRNNIDSVNQFLLLSKSDLTWSKDEQSWSILQCIEHLNRYSDFYLNEFSRKLDKKDSNQGKDFKSGYWGKMFTTGMLPDEKMKTMNTFKSKNPLKSEVSKNVLNKFLEDQKLFLDYLEKFKSVDLNVNKCRITIPLLKMNLGDTLRFYAFHNVRHISQAECVLN